MVWYHRRSAEPQSPSRKRRAFALCMETSAKTAFLHKNTTNIRNRANSLGALAQLVAAHSHRLVYSLPDAEDSDESSAFFLGMIDARFHSCYHIHDKLEVVEWINIL